jgi:hypothetical protein
MSVYRTVHTSVVDPDPQHGHIHMLLISVWSLTVNALFCRCSRGSVQRKSIFSFRRHYGGFKLKVLLEESGVLNR